MKKLKSDITNMVLSLTIITLVAATLLAVVNKITMSKISTLQQETLQTGIKNVMQDANCIVTKIDTLYDEKDSKKIHFIVYTTENAQHQSLGKAVASTENAFAGPLTVLVGFNQAGSIKGYTVLNTTETPGLGLKAEEWFRSKKGNVIGLNMDQVNFTVTKDGGDIDAITASTITSRAFLKAIQNAYQKTREKKTDTNSGASQKCSQK
ncbi:MAG: RnfABCDGE type electron transport complex subunit G [Bacteroidaceae bacterium]